MNSGEEQIDDLYLHGLKIIQKKDHFRYGTDAVALSDFAAKYIAKGSRVLDIGTGTGILPILLSGKTEAARFVGIEIQRDMAEMAARSVEMNESAGVLERSRIRIEACDIQTADRLFPTRSFDAVVTNPPYKRRGSGILNETEQLQIARHEITCTLSEWIERSAFFLKSGGHFMMVNHPERLADAIEALRNCRLEPKELQFVYADRQSRPILFLVHAVLFGGKNLIVEKGMQVK